MAFLLQVNSLSLVMNIRLSRDSEIEREMPCLVEAKD